MVREMFEERGIEKNCGSPAKFSSSVDLNDQHQSYHFARAEEDGSMSRERGREKKDTGT